MICNKCGATIPDDSVFCENCGANLEPSEPMEEVEIVEDNDSIERSDEGVESVGQADENNDFREIEELEAMEEVEYEEYDKDETAGEVEPFGGPQEESMEESVDEPVLPPIEEMEFEETGQPEGSEAEWLESFQQMSPREEDRIEESTVSEVGVGEAMEEEDSVEELEEEEIPVEGIDDDEVPIEEFEKKLAEEEPDTEEMEDPAVEEMSKEAPEEIPIEELADDLTEEEPSHDDDAEDSVVDEAMEAVSDGAKKVGAWLGSIGKQVHTGTGWAVDAAKEKATKLKDEKAIKAERKSDRDQWSEEEEGELDLGYNFWYKSNQADSSMRYEGMDQEEAKEPDRSEDDATTYVAVKTGSGFGGEIHRSDEDGDADGSGIDGEQKAKKPESKLKVTVIVLLIAAVIGGAGIFATKSHTENEQKDAYQESLTKAEQLVEAKDYPSAEKIYTDLIAEYPDRAELYEALAGVYIAEEKYDDAKNIINEGIARTGKNEKFIALSEDIKALTSTEWKEPFRRALADNEWAVKRYDDVNGASIALCDITGDKRPEMLFFTQEYYGYGKLHIFVYEDEKAKEVTYECKNRSTQYQDAFYDIENNDSGYVVYKSKEPGKFGIYESFLHGGVDAWQTTNRYTMSGSDCKRENVIEACITTSYRVSDDDDEEEAKTKYYKNEKKIKYDTYIKEFNGVLDDIDKVIIASDNTAGDKEIWNRIMEMDDASMSYDGAMKILDEDAT